jgi:hypothetical protein
MAKRLLRVDAMMREGQSSRKIQQELGNEWGITRRTVRGYIAKIWKEWEKDSQPTPQRAAQRRSQLETVYQRALRSDDYKAAVQALDRLCRLDMLYPVEQVQIGVEGKIGVGVGLAALGFKSPDDARNRIVELRERLSNGGPIAAAHLATGEPEPDEKPGNGSGNGHG